MYAARFDSMRVQFCSSRGWWASSNLRGHSPVLTSRLEVMYPGFSQAKLDTFPGTARMSYALTSSW